MIENKSIQNFSIFKSILRGKQILQYYIIIIILNIYYLFIVTMTTCKNYKY